MHNVVSHSLFTDFDIDLFKSGKHFRLYHKFGAHPVTVDGVEGTYFAVYAPAAAAVEVIGDFNGWTPGTHKLYVRWDGSGIWEGFIPGLGNEAIYKYHITSTNQGMTMQKSDPYAFHCETPPKTASVIWDKEYTWQDGEWMQARHAKNGIEVPMSVYEMHVGSWRRHLDENLPYTYRELAEVLPGYLREMEFTHVEFMPIMEHPYDPSWGYQVTGYFAPSSRFGTPEDFKYLVDKLHQAGIGVILDWVPSHFPADGHALGNFDGSCVYEHPDRRKGYHPDWKSLIFNFERNEVRAFLISNALYWLDEFHIDGLRVDAVASMVYLDYSREDGEWEPNEYGGKEYLAAISFLKEFNETVYGNYPDTITIAEESTAFPGVSKPTFAGGLGFGMKWMMGWMHDTLNYFKIDPLYRKYHHHSITFSMIYAYSENYMLPFSHDEVVYGKGSLLSRMPGDGPLQFAHLRVLLSYMYAHPGAKLLFMGGEIGQRNEWDFRSSIEWHLLQYESHEGVQICTRTLNHLYRTEPALHRKCTDPEGFEWLNIDDWQNSVMCFLRKSENPEDTILVVLNFTPVERTDYKVGVPLSAKWKQVYNSQDPAYWGMGQTGSTEMVVQDVPSHGKDQSVEIVIPPISAIYYKHEGPLPRKKAKRKTPSKKKGKSRTKGKKE